MRLFIFAIGGTGARVLRALTMLLAAGVRTPDHLTIVPILLDMDMQNGDAARTLRALQWYRTIRSGAYGSATDIDRTAFFSTPIEPLEGQESDEKREEVGDSFLPQLTDHRGTFEEFLQISKMEEIDREFLRLLYDNSNDPQRQELKLNLSVGFKGNPNIGSVVFNGLEDAALYRHFTGAFNDDTDRIFVISSIFGGTGSSGFPQLLKLLQEKGQKTPIRHAKKGAITVKPYFSVHENKAGAIDQNRFHSKAKAALTYYKGQIQLDALYYIGDRAGMKPYPNVEGGIHQCDPAHVLEMLAAEAVVDFANRKSEELVNGRTFFEYGLQAESPQLSFGHLGDSTFQQVLMPVLRLAYAAKIYTDFIPEHLRESFSSKAGLDLADAFGTDPFYASLQAFFSSAAPGKPRASFRDWLMEMAENDRACRLFDFDANFNGLVLTKQIETNTFLGFGARGITSETLLKAANEAEKKWQSALPQQRRRFLVVLMEMADKCREKLGSLNRIVA